MSMPTNGRELTYAQAINEAMREEMRRDENIVIIGEDVGRRRFYSVRRVDESRFLYDLRRCRVCGGSADAIVRSVVEAADGRCERVSAEALTRAYLGHRNTLDGTVRSRAACKSAGSARKNVVLSVLPNLSSTW